mgnify:FL=1
MAEKISLADQAYHTMKERILNLTYPPGMQLTETMLAEELNMSRNPIRTALKTLHAEGLVVRDYYKSIIVKEITDKDIEEIYQLRELVEGAAFREIFTSGRADEFSYRIEERVVRMCACAGDIYHWELADTQMHMEIVSVFDNERINRIYEMYLNEVIRMGLYSVRNGLHISRANENLKKMIRYMRSDQYEKAYEILRNDHFMIGKSSALKK